MPLATTVNKRLFPAWLLMVAGLAGSGCGIKLPQANPVEFERFDLSDIVPVALPPRPSGTQITDFAVEYIVDLDVPAGQPGQDSEVRVVLPHPKPAGKIPTLVVNGAGAYLFSGMVLSDEDIEPMLPYVERGFAVIAYETDGCQPDFDREPTPGDIAEMTRRYVASKAGLVNAKRALSFALERFPEIDADQLYTIGHSSGGKQALLLAAHDDRIRGCVAFAPACQMDFGSKMTVARIGGADGDLLSREVARSMPLVHAADTEVPMLLVYSKNDRVTRPQEVLTYAEAVGDQAVAVPVRCDGHGSVPDAGFKVALAWLQSRAKQNSPHDLETTLVSQSAESVVEEETAAVASPPPSVPDPVSTVPAAAFPAPAAAAEEMPKPLPLPVQQRSVRHPTLNPAGVQLNPYLKD